jgi:hypothetical protein
MALISNGTTIFDNGSMASGFGADLKFISKATASASASIEFTSGIDSTYKEYVFYFHSIHPSVNNAHFGFQVNAVGGSGYNETITSSVFRALHQENDSTPALQYDPNNADKAQGTDLQYLQDYVGADTDQACAGYLQLFNPSSTNFVKHFTARMANYNGNDYAVDQFTAGYINTISSIDQVQFKFHTGNIDAGQILLFGVN